jgi:histone-lysine N-methyltransferase SETD3
MNKLPLIEPKKKPISSKTEHLSIPTKYPKGLTPLQNEDDKRKNNLYGNNYDIAINYYTKNINNEKDNTTFLIKRAICYLAKGYYNLALKDALQTIEIDQNFNKGYYIASLCYLEMYDIKLAEKFSENNGKNKRLKALIEKNKKDLAIKTKKYKSYPLYIKFLRELYKYNSFFPKLEIHFYTDDYRGVLAKSNILKDEIIMTIPKDCLISLETAFETEYGKKIGEFMYKELNSPKHCLLTTFLLYEEKNPKYKYYFDLLPKDFSNFPQFYTSKELEYFKGSPFLAQIIEKKKDMKSDYLKLCEHLPDFKQFSYLKYCQARLLISSRIFGISINDVKTDVLAPFADLLNHKRPRQTQWYYDDDLESFVIQATEDIKEGSEIFDSYGKKTNARFLLNYGFCLEDNDTSEFAMTIAFNESYPLFEQKKNFFQNECELVRTFNLNNNFYESQIIELLSFLRFILFEGDMEELYNAISSSENIYNEEIPLTFYYIHPISKELEIKVLKHLSLLCRRALGKYPTTFEEDQNLLKSKKNISFNLRNSLLLLMSEKTVLSYFIYFCEYCLELLKLKTQMEVLTKLSTDYKYNDCQFDFYIQEIVLQLVNDE